MLSVEFDTRVMVKGVAVVSGNVLRWWCEDEEVYGCKFGGEIWWDGERFPTIKFLADARLVEEKGVDWKDKFVGGLVKGLMLDCKRGLLVNSGGRWEPAVVADDHHPDPWRGVTQQLFRISHVRKVIELIRLFPPSKITVVPCKIGGYVIVSIKGRNRGWVKVRAPSAYGRSVEYTLNKSARSFLSHLMKYSMDMDGVSSIYGFTNALVIELSGDGTTLRYILRLKARTGR